MHLIDPENDSRKKYCSKPTFCANICNILANEKRLETSKQTKKAPKLTFQAPIGATFYVLKKS